jgi:transposase InsO family protein
MGRHASVFYPGREPLGSTLPQQRRSVLRRVRDDPEPMAMVIPAQRLAASERRQRRGPFVGGFEVSFPTIHQRAKRVFYRDEGLTVRTKPRKRLASRARAPVPAPTRPNERWSMDFVSARLVDGRWFRTLTVLDVFTRASSAWVADRSLTGVKVAAAVTPIVSSVSNHRPYAGCGGPG